MNDVTRAAAAIIVDPEGRVLLALQNYGQHRWGLPGNHVNGTDAPDAAVVREVLCETGLETRVVDLVGLYHLTGGDLPDLLTYVFRCEVMHGEAVVNQPGRIQHLSWCAPTEVPSPATVTACAALSDAAAGRAGVIRHLNREALVPVATAS